MLVTVCAEISNSFAWKWSGKFSLYSQTVHLKYIQCNFSPFLFCYWKYSWFFFISFSEGHFELTNKPYITTSYVSFYLKRFPLEIVLRSWWFFPFCTLLFIIFASRSQSLSNHTHSPTYYSYKTFSFYFFFSLTPTAFTLHFKCTEKCITFGSNLCLHLGAFV